MPCFHPPSRCIVLNFNLTERSSCSPTRVFITCWDITDPLKRFKPWEMAQRGSNPVPEAMGDNVLHWTQHSLSTQHEAACVSCRAPHWLRSVIDHRPRWYNRCAFKAGGRVICVSSSYCPLVSILSGGSDRKLTHNLTVALCSRHNQCKVCFQHPALLLGTSPQGGNEVMLFRNRLIYQDNGPLAISQGAVPSRTNQMPGNQCPQFLFISLSSHEGIRTI